MDDAVDKDEHVNNVQERDKNQAETVASNTNSPVPIHK